MIYNLIGNIDVFTKSLKEQGYINKTNTWLYDDSALTVYEKEKVFVIHGITEDYEIKKDF